jgi:hypothetical protein
MLAAVKEIYEERSWAQLPGPERIISVDTATAISRADFGLDRPAQRALYLAGRRDTLAFLEQRNLGKGLPVGASAVPGDATVAPVRRAVMPALVANAS